MGRRTFRAIPLAIRAWQEKDTFRFSSQNKKSLMYPLPLLQIRHSIFFSIRFNSGSDCFWHKKRGRRQTRFLNLKKPHLIADLAGNIFASCQSILIAVFWTALLRRCFSLTVLSRQPLYIQFYTFLLLGYRNSLTKKYLLILRIRIFAPHTGH